MLRRLARVLDPFHLPIVCKAGRKPLHDPRPLLHFPQQQPAPVTGDRSAVKPTRHLALI
jgi:hypothetical protein